MNRAIIFATLFLSSAIACAEDLPTELTINESNWEYIKTHPEETAQQNDTIKLKIDLMRRPNTGQHIWFKAMQQLIIVGNAQGKDNFFQECEKLMRILHEIEHCKTSSCVVIDDSNNPMHEE